MGKLRDTIKKSGIMNIRIKYGDEIIKFNLNDELKVNEAQMNKELKEQPSYFGFLTLLHATLAKKVADLNQEKKSVIGDIWLEYKGERDPSTGRPYSKEAINSLVDSDKKVKKITIKYNKAVFEASRIEGALKAFEQRSYLLQTLSANSRRG